MYRNKLILIAVAASLLTLSSCKKRLDDMLANPNVPTLDKADTDLYLNAAQLSFKDVFSSLSDRGMEMSRTWNMGGSIYLNSYRPETFNGVWGNAYRNVLTQINAMEPLARAQNRFFHLGIGQVMKAYTGMALVDFFGDVPWTEAANPANSVINPKIDKGVDVYTNCLGLLDSALTNFAKTAASSPTNDLYYNGNKTRWITLAKTLKLKAYMTTRLVDADAGNKIAAIVTAGDIIDTEAEDFVFRFGTQLENPNSRHPKYNDCYRASGGVGIYISNYLAWEMVTEKGMIDPRTRYYFRRQITARSGQTSSGQFIIPATAVACQGALSPGHYPTGMAYCMAGDGYFGRDHGDPSGIPPDGQYRTAWGIYPAGGDFDALAVNTGAASSVQASQVTLTGTPGARGAGIHPIWLSSYTHFLLAEAQLALGGTATAARTLLDAGVRQSITKVLNFPGTMTVTPNPSFVPSTAEITQYVNAVLGAFDVAATNTAKLNVVMKEYHIASFGNGIEPYNSYRRTGMPTNMQPMLNPQPGPFIRSVWYPTDHVTLNLNAKQKTDNTVKVFWDNGSATCF
jgi:hypothetical protein